MTIAVTPPGEAPTELLPAVRPTVARRPRHRTPEHPLRPALDEPPPSRWHHLAAIVPALSVLALVLPGIGRRQLWNDELATWHATSDLSWPGLWKLLSNVDLSVAQYYAIMQLWVDAAGDSPTALRLPSAIAMSAAAGLITLVGRRLFNTGAGLIAGLIFSGLPVVSRYGQEARPYAFTIAGVLAGTLLLMRAVERPTFARWTAYTGCMIFLGWSHMVAVIVIAAHLLVVVFAYRDRVEPRLWWWTASMLTTATCVLPLARAASKQSGAIQWIKADQVAVIAFPLKLFGSYPVALLIAALALIGGAALWRTNRPAAAFLACWALLPPLFTYVSFPLLHLFLFRYLLFTLPAWALLAAVGIYSVGRAVAHTPRGRAAATVAAAAVGLAGLGWLGAPGQVEARRSPVLGQPDYRAAINVVAAHQRPGDGIVYNDSFGRLSDLARKAVRYEFRHGPAPRDLLLHRTAEERGSYSAEECADATGCIKNTSRIWIIATNWGDPRDGIPSSTVLRRQYHLRHTFEFEGVRLALLVHS